MTRIAKLFLIVLSLAAVVLALAHFSSRARNAHTAHPLVKRDARGLDRSGRTVAETQAVLRAAIDGLRPAEDKDGEDTEARRELVDLYSEYHPFFARGDLDGDGYLDFAQAYLEPRKDGVLVFDVAVFFGRPDGTFSEPVIVQRGVDLAAGDLSIERSVLTLTPDLAVDESQRLRCEPLDRHFYDADAGVSDDDSPDEGPDERPRART
jgi:hypothetical protein